jgi:hypothetical protein
MAATSKPAAAVVLVTRSEDGMVTICDANGKSRACRTIGEYAAAVNAILDDPKLPELEDVHPHKAQVEEVVVAGVREAVPAFLKPFVRPGLQTAQLWLSKLSDVRRPPRKKRRGRRRAPTPSNGRAA